jgi:hypothetical protein
MASTFPTNPTNAQVAEVGGRYYSYNTAKGVWENIGAVTGSATIGNLTVTGTATVEVLSVTTVSTNASFTIGNLTVSGNQISSGNTNGNISLIPNGTGDVILSSDTVIVGDAATATIITTNGAGNLTLNTNSGTNSGSISIAQGTNGNIAITPNGTGVVSVANVKFNGNTITFSDTTTQTTAGINTGKSIAMAIVFG